MIDIFLVVDAKSSKSWTEMDQAYGRLMHLGQVQLVAARDATQTGFVSKKVAHQGCLCSQVWKARKLGMQKGLADEYYHFGACLFSHAGVAGYAGTA